MAQGRFPFWNPYILCGYPDQGEGQNGPMYPLHVLAFCRTLTSRVTLRHDYLEHDFTVYLYRDA